VTVDESFALARSEHAIAVSLGTQSPVADCQQSNQFLLAGEPEESAATGVGGFAAQKLPDGDLLVTSQLQEGQTLLAFDREAGFVNVDKVLPGGAFLVFLSKGATKALHPISIEALNQAIGPERRNRIVDTRQLQDALSEAIAEKTKQAIEIHTKALTQDRNLRDYFDSQSSSKPLGRQVAVDAFNAVTAVFPCPGFFPIEERVSMEQTDEQFKAAFKPFHEHYGQIFRYLRNIGLGADMTILVVDPLKALDIS
jgi:hypothetical protein